jgi:Zn-finger nucleic acid-binding protein
MADALRCEICRSQYAKKQALGIKIKQCPKCDIVEIDLSAFPGHIAKGMLSEVTKLALERAEQHAEGLRKVS